MWELDVPPGAEPVGYKFLLEQLKIDAIPHYRWSYITNNWDSKVYKYETINLELHIYPKSFQFEQLPLKHVEFALKHEGMNFEILKQVFLKIGEDAVIKHILSAPSGKYSRKIWFLYEFLLEKRLDLENLAKGPYVELIDSKKYYTGKSTKSLRHRVIDNLLGTKEFCPFVRRSPILKQFEEKDLRKVADRLTRNYNQIVLTRAIRYLYTKETMASWEIEREKPDSNKLERFIGLLQQDHTTSELSKQFLLMIQKEIVDPRFYLNDYRDFQNYVGEEPSFGKILVHYIPPKPKDLQSLMEGLIESTGRMFSSDVDPVVIAAILSFAFVFMHPFWDGNGRLHRFLIHYILSKRKFTPDGIIFPISAVMLREHKEYDNVLEYFSKSLGKLIKYEFNELGEMTVEQDTKIYYQYIDFTPIAEYLYRCVEKTIHSDLETELEFLSRYDAIKHSLKQVVDMPDREIDLFIKCVKQNNGTLSARKRESLFSMLTDAEILAMQKIIAN